MRYDSAASRTQDWRTLQVQTAAGRRPVEDELNDVTGDGELAKLVRAIRQLAVSGLPPDPRCISVSVAKVKRKGWTGPVVWYLKPPHSSYRAYVAQLPDRQLLFLNIVEKRSQKRPRGSDDRAFQRLKEHLNGTGASVELQLGSR